MTETIIYNGRTFPVTDYGLARGNDRSPPSPPASTKKRNKYNAQSVVVDGVRHDSKTELRRDHELKILALAGRITNLKRKPVFDLIVNGQKVTRYVGDWRYTEDGLDVVEDRKGVLTREFKIKWALAKALHPEIEWRLS